MVVVLALELKLQVNNGIEGIVDLEKELYGEIFEPLKNKSLFEEVFVTSRTIEWPNGADFAPEFLFEIAVNKQLVSDRSCEKSNALSSTV